MTDVPNLVRARLAGEAPMEHPDANVLAAFSEQSLPLSEREPVLAHLARCADCREVVALALPVVETQAAPARVFGTAWRMPALRWAAVVTCFLVVGAAVLREGGREHGASYPAPASRHCGGSPNGGVRTVDRRSRARRICVAG